MMVKMKPAIQKGSKGYLVHCPQCGQFLMVLSKGEAVIHCPQCGTNKKAIIRGGRITIFELSEIPGTEDSKRGLSGRQRR
ncbi:MAG: hypothetical protein ACI4W2_12335 [Eubacterium sp.]